MQKSHLFSLWHYGDISPSIKVKLIWLNRKYTESYRKKFRTIGTLNKLGREQRFFSWGSRLSAETVLKKYVHQQCWKHVPRIFFVKSISLLVTVSIKSSTQHWWRQRWYTWVLAALTPTKQCLWQQCRCTCASFWHCQCILHI